MKLVQQVERTLREFTKEVGSDTMDMKVERRTNYTERRLDKMEPIILNITTRTKQSGPNKEEVVERARREISHIYIRLLVKFVVGMTCLFTFDRMSNPVWGGVLLGIMLVILPQLVLDVDRGEKRIRVLEKRIERLTSEETL